MIIGGDACFTESPPDAKHWEVQEPWEALGRILTRELDKSRPGVVAYGPQMKAPDAIASGLLRGSMRHLKAVGLCYERSGEITATGFDHRPDQAGWYRSRPCGRWSDQPTAEGLVMALAERAFLAIRAGWPTRVLIFHGWTGTWRGEYLCEAMEHLGIQCEEWDVSTEGRVLAREETI